MINPKVPALLFAGVASISLQISAETTEELVVSGYRPEATREIDTSITLMDSSVIELATLSHVEELVQLVPNMNLSGEGSRARYFQLRGVGEREQYEGAPNPSVGFIVDDIDLSGIGGVASSFDLEQVDVLRGPQSARYGSSALAGIVYMQSVLPEQEFDAKAELTGGSEDTLAAGFALGGGLSDSMSARVSVYQYQDNGFRDNAFLGRDNTNERDELTARARFNWAVNTDWNILVSALYADFENGYDAFALDNGAVTYSDEPGNDSQDTRAMSVKVTGPLFSGVDVVSISSIANSDISFSYDGDWVNEQYWLPIISDYRYSNPRERDMLSQEFRLVSNPDGRLFGGSTDWVSGLQWNRLEESNFIDSTGDYVDASVGCDPGFCITDRRISSEYEADTLALFASTDSQLSERLSLSLGLRAEHWQADYLDSWVDNGVMEGPVSASNRFDPDETMLGGHVSLNYDFSDELRGYARVARGFKAGGFNPSLAALGALPDALGAEYIPYEPEYLWNYELGVKGAWLEGDLVADVSVFYMDRDDAQLSQSTQIDPVDPNTFVFVTGNGQADGYGLEASAIWQLSDSWQIHTAIGLLDTDIQQWAVRPEAEGRDLAHAPSYSINAGASWSGPAGWFARLDVNAVDQFYFDISHDQYSKAYQIVNLRLGKSWDHWAVSLWGRNIFDENYATRGFYFGNEPPGFAPQLYTKFGDPRQVGLTIKYQY